MFDDPNYTKPRAGSAIGALLTSFAGNKQRQEALGQSDPNRPLNLRDMLDVVKDLHKQTALNNALYAQVPGYQAQETDIASFIKSLAQAQQILTGQGGGLDSLKSASAQPAQNPATSILQKYGIDPNQSAPLAPAPTAPVSVNKNPVGGTTKDYSSLWRSK